MDADGSCDEVCDLQSRTVGLLVDTHEVQRLRHAAHFRSVKNSPEGEFELLIFETAATLENNECLAPHLSASLELKEDAFEAELEGYLVRVQL